jgi:transcriptional regulator with XRE-family HTH domain
MALDQPTLAKRLREARDASGLTQEQLAGELKLPRTAIVQIESGKRAVSTLELVMLAKLFHCDIADFISEELNPSEGPLVLHRLDVNLKGSPEIQRKVQHCLEICREGIELESILKRPERSGPPAYRLPTPKNPGEAALQGAAVALKNANGSLWVTLRFRTSRISSTRKASGRPPLICQTPCRGCSCITSPSGW